MTHLLITFNPVLTVVILGMGLYLNHKLNRLFGQKQFVEKVSTPSHGATCEICTLNVTRHNMIEGKITCANCEQELYFNNAQ